MVVNYSSYSYIGLPPYPTARVQTQEIPPREAS
jgi:hypothetical protein